MRSTSQMSCSIVFSQMPPNMCHLPVYCCTDSYGAVYSNVQVLFWMRKRLVGSQVYIPTCLPVARDEDGGSLLLCFMLCIVRLDTIVTGFTL
jgi:hypothetical protein